MAIPSSWSLIFEVKSTESELAFGRLRQSSEDFGRLRKNSDFFGNLRKWSCRLQKTQHSQDKNLTLISQKNLTGIKAIDYLCIIVHWKCALRRQLVYNFGCLSLKIIKLAFHVLEMIFCLRVSATVIALSTTHPRGVLFWLFVYFLKLKRKIFEMMPC